MAESRRFLCPSCGEVLSDPECRVVRLAGVLEGPHFTLTCSFELPARLGEYGGSGDADVCFEEGCRVDFACPECGHALGSSSNPDLAEITMVEGDRTFVVVFNIIYGEHSSFVIDQETRKLVAKYGEDADAYVAELGKSVNYFGS